MPRLCPEERRAPAPVSHRCRLSSYRPFLAHFISIFLRLPHFHSLLASPPSYPPNVLSLSSLHDVCLSVCLSRAALHPHERRDSISLASCFQGRRTPAKFHTPVPNTLDLRNVTPVLARHGSSHSRELDMVGNGHLRRWKPIVRPLIPFT